MTPLFHSAILQAWECALGSRKVIYLSGPITTGLSLLERIRSGETISSEMIVRDNSNALIETANRLRAQLSEVVIEPASLHIPGWTQLEYLELWKECIRKHARVVMFMADWQYSVGCVTEFSFAEKHDVRTEKVDGTRLGADEALALLDVAQRDLYPDRQHPRLKVLYETVDAARSNLLARNHL